MSFLCLETSKYTCNLVAAHAKVIRMVCKTSLFWTLPCLHYFLLCPLTPGLLLPQSTCVLPMLLLPPGLQIP